LGSNASAWSPWTVAFVKRLRELGWIEGRTIAIEYRWSEGRPERNAEIAAEFVRLKLEVIVTNNFALPALMQATEVIPIVFATGTDPVGGGLVASLARPGGNVTGLSMQSTDLASKRLELLREVLPRLRRLATIGNASNPRRARVQLRSRRDVGIGRAPQEDRGEPQGDRHHSARCARRRQIAGVSGAGEVTRSGTTKADRTTPAGRAQILRDLDADLGPPKIGGCQHKREHGFLYRSWARPGTARSSNPFVYRNWRLGGLRLPDLRMTLKL